MLSPLPSDINHMVRCERVHVDLSKQYCTYQDSHYIRMVRVQRSHPQGNQGRAQDTLNPVRRLS